MKRTWLITMAAMLIAGTALGQQGRGPGGGGRGPGGPGGGGRGPGGGGLGDLLRGMGGGRGGGGAGDWQQRMLEMASRSGMTFNEQPTLRMSLFEVVQRIGGPKAEAVLLGELNATSRGAEVVKLDQLLEQMVGNKYKDVVLDAAHAVLVDEAVDTGFRVDARGTDQLWGLLRKYEDKTFSAAAQNMILDDEGRFNRGARDYLQYVLGENIMEVYVQLYEDPDLELSDDTRRSIREAAGRNMGESDAANRIVTSRFKEAMDQLANPPAEPAEGEQGSRRRGGSDPKRTAEYYLGRLVSTREREVTAESITGRQALLGKFRATTSDPDVVAMMDKVGARLDAMAADPTKIRELPRFSLRERREGEEGGEGGSRLDRFRNRNREGGGERPGPGGGGARPRPPGGQ